MSILPIHTDPVAPNDDLTLAGFHRSPIPTSRFRVALVSLLGIVPLTLFIQWSDLQVGGTMSAGPFPPLAACLQWVILWAGSALWAKVRQNTPPLTRSEWLVVFAVWCAANMVAGRGMLHPLLCSLAGPTYYARDAGLKAAISEHLPAWMAITSRTAAVHFFEGYGVAVPWAVWLHPLTVWALFFAPFLLANVCLCGLLEQVWVREEHLSFPLVALPLEGMGASSGRKDRWAMALGLAVPFLLHGFGVANAYLPNVPCLPFFNDLSALATDLPWSAARPLYLNIYPLLIGVTFLAPTDVTLSIWFFLLLNKAELIATAGWGWADGASGGTAPSPPYLQEQSAGAFLTLAALLVGSARHSVCRRLASAGEEGRSLRVLVVGLVLGGTGMLAWLTWTGIPLWFSVGFLGFYFAVALVLSRLMAQGGLPWLLAPIMPDKLILSLTGSTALSPLATTRLMLHSQHLRDTRQLLAPTIFQAGKLRDVAQYPTLRFYGLILAATFLALTIGALSALPIFYQHGALLLAPNNDGLQMSAQVIPLTATGYALPRLTRSVTASPETVFPLAAGAAMTWMLYFLRLRFLGWPLHPLGYALTGTLQTGYANKMLFSIFAGWALKSLVVRYGGPQGFRLLRGMALGLIFGDLLVGGILKLLDALFGPSGYAIF